VAAQPDRWRFICSSEATVDAMLNRERPAPQHLRWPDLDVDPAVDSIEHPERYPLKFNL
jgi:hypothetical protein